MQVFLQIIKFFGFFNLQKDRIEFLDPKLRLFSTEGINIDQEKTRQQTIQKSEEGKTPTTPTGKATEKNVSYKSGFFLGYLSNDTPFAPLPPPP